MGILYGHTRVLAGGPSSWMEAVSEFFGSEFSRHPEGLSFSGLRSEFSRYEFSSHPHPAVRWTATFRQDKILEGQSFGNS